MSSPITEVSTDFEPNRPSSVATCAEMRSLGRTELGGFAEPSDQWIPTGASSRVAAMPAMFSANRRSSHMRA